MTYPMLPDEYQRLARVQSAHEQELFDKENVVGVAIGNKYVNGEDTGRLSIVVFVSAKMPPDIIPEDQMLPSSLDDVLVDVRESGYFQPQQVQGPGALRLRPAVGGLSISHQNGGPARLVQHASMTLHRGHLCVTTCCRMHTYSLCPTCLAL
jgi:hypothetical protein